MVDEPPPKPKPPLCSAHPHDFLDNDNAEGVQRALDTCTRCQLARPDQFAQCAQDALAAGTTTDLAVKACANGVVQAGIVCRGDLHTWRQLKNQLGQPPEEDRCEICDRSFTTVTQHHDGICNGCAQILVRHELAAPSAGRNTPPPNCRGCNAPMSRNANPRPDGWVRHAAHGYCRRCHKQAAA